MHQSNLADQLGAARDRRTRRILYPMIDGLVGRYETY